MEHLWAMQRMRNRLHVHLRFLSTEHVEMVDTCKTVHQLRQRELFVRVYDNLMKMNQEEVNSCAERTCRRIFFIFLIKSKYPPSRQLLLIKQLKNKTFSAIY